MWLITGSNEGFYNTDHIRRLYWESKKEWVNEKKGYTVLLYAEISEDEAYLIGEWFGEGDVSEGEKRVLDEMSRIFTDMTVGKVYHRIADTRYKEAKEMQHDSN